MEDGVDGGTGEGRTKTLEERERERDLASEHASKRGRTGKTEGRGKEGEPML